MVSLYGFIDILEVSLTWRYWSNRDVSLIEPLDEMPHNFWIFFQQWDCHLFDLSEA